MTREKGAWVGQTTAHGDLTSGSILTLGFFAYTRSDPDPSPSRVGPEPESSAEGNVGTEVTPQVVVNGPRPGTRLG